MKKTLATIAALAILTIGCVPKSQIKRAEEEAYKKADAECLTIQNKLAAYIKSLQDQLTYKNTLLRKFNQVDEDGDLYKPPAGVEKWGK